MSDPDRRVAALIEETLGPPGRMVARSKSRYRARHRDHAVVFNARLFVQGTASPPRVSWAGDLDLTIDEPLLAELAARLGATLHVLYEALDPSGPTPGPLVASAVFSVTASGHYRFEHEAIERARDGTLRRRAQDVSSESPQRVMAGDDDETPLRRWQTTS